MMRAQVVVVGGGPVGMLVAAELAGYGVDTVVLEARGRVSERPKATTLHARAVQSLARRGHLPERAGRAGGSADFHFGGVPGLVITAPGTEPEPILKCPQAELERLFEARARAAGARVLREHRVSAIAEDGDGVRIEARGPHGPVTCFASYLVGADGARGTVRRQAGIEADSAPPTVYALTGIARLRDPDALEPGWRRTPRGWTVSKRTPDGYTHIRTLDCAGAYQDRDREPTPEEFRREVSRIAGRDIEMDETRWISRFSDFTRLARTFREGRVLLVGDAAHVHFPIGGQGLSTGVLDALNLGWKLALTVRGAAGEDLLDTYDRERRPAAREVVDNTRAQLALMRPGTDVDALRAVVADLVAADRATGRLADMISAQGTVLPPLGVGATREPSPWEGRFLTNTPLTTAEGGTDVIALLREGRPLLLLLGEKGRRHEARARPWGDTVRVVHALETPEVPCEALLVRPDGYVAWAAGEDGGLGEALSWCFPRKRAVDVGS
ncbi:FAD-dependent monooxygenase [Streptomyces sp. RerS4]|uniref:FAD-dependent monooxygenase n=1 Tax=Streptomyces sp. RerS4 TaxID=2942449 RepID=UPI00201C6C1F|nr:FAD-dependent monooxygenase [Streptomyces sp. RerS4]UQX05314.1 FAD-dependent monooxygenase [Streptomyces sp. RerS4]